MKYLFCPILIISLFIFILGCGEDPEPEPGPTGLPEVISTMPAEGGGQGGNAPVTFTLNKALAEATVSGADGTTAIQGKNVVFTPSLPIPAGPVTLSLSGKDASDQEIIYSLTFTAYGLPEGPVFIGNECDPIDGAVNVNPREYQDGLLLVFDEALSVAIITSTKPEFDYTLTIIDDNGFFNKLMIEFVDYAMPYETNFIIGICVVDIAGSSSELSYSFTTMAKAGI